MHASHCLIYEPATNNISVGLSSASGLCVASVSVRVAAAKHNCVTNAGSQCRFSMLGAKISVTAHLTVLPNEAKWVVVALHSVLKYSTGGPQSALGILPPINSNLRTLCCGRCRTPTHRKVPRERLEPDLLHMPVKSCVALGCCTILASAHEAVRTHARARPVPKAHLVPLFSALRLRGPL